MRQVCTVPLSIAVAVVTVLLTVAVVVPRSGAGIAVAASAPLAVAFRDLPASVRAGDSLRVLVDVPGGSLCEGLITYRDNSTQTLTQIQQDDGRCRWDVVVPDAVRRGESDIVVTVKNDKNTARVASTFEVARRSDDVGLVLKKLPGAVKRNSSFTVRINVPDKANCSGTITYEDGKTQALDLRNEDNEQCRWDLTVPSDVERGEARLSVTIAADSRVSTLLTSFDVSRGTDDPDVMVAFQDLVTTVHQDGALPIRVLVPSTAKCKGEVTFRSADNVKLPEIAGDGGVCRWTANVPEEAKQGESKIKVTVSNEGQDTSISATVAVQERSNDVDANFKDLPGSIKRGDDLEVRVSVPDNATCTGQLRFDDGGIATLAQQTEKKDRCFWTERVPSFTPRGKVIVFVTIDDHGAVSTLTANVDVEGREDEPLSATWDSVQKDVVPGQSFDVSLTVATSSTCVGKIEFTGGLKWVLGDKAEENSHCRWRVDVPNHAGVGKATIKVDISKGKDTTTLTSNLDVKALTAPATGTPSTTTASVKATATPTSTPAKATLTATPTSQVTTQATPTATSAPSDQSAPPPPQINVSTPTPTPDPGSSAGGAGEASGG